MQHIQILSCHVGSHKNHTHALREGSELTELAAVSDRASGAAVLRMPERTERERQRKERILRCSSKWCQSKRPLNAKMKRKEQIKRHDSGPRQDDVCPPSGAKNPQSKRDAREREREREEERERESEKGGKFKRLQSTAEKGKREQRKQRIWGEKVSGLISL